MSPRVGLVLGAGGATGSGFHAGVLAALHDALGFDARTAAVIVGTSAGAATGALVRAGLSAADLAARACGEPLSAHGVRVMRAMGSAPAYVAPRPSPPSPRPSSLAGVIAAGLRPWNARVGTVAAALVGEGTLSTEPMAALFRQLYGGRWSAEPLWLCAVRLDDGRRVVFDQAMPGIDVGTAVAASCAVPGWFSPVVINGARYVDGGAFSPTNADLLREGGVDALIVSAPMSSTPAATGVRIDAPSRYLHHSYLLAETAWVRSANMPVLVVEPTRDDLDAFGPNPMDALHRAAVTRAVRSSVAARLLTGDLQRAAVAIGLSPS